MYIFTLHLNYGLIISDEKIFDVLGGMYAVICRVP